MATLTYGHKGHPFICGIYCSFQQVDKLYYVLPYAANSELAMWLRRLGSFDVHVSQFYASEILAALEYIHECGIIHRDLKPENVLIRHDWHIMLSDFGSCKVIGYEGDRKMRNPRKQVKQRSTFVGTAQYISPEVASSKSCGPEADFWALGGIIFHMISGQPPFRGINEYQILQKVHKLLYSFPPGFDEKAKELVKLLLVTEVENRLGHNGIEEIKSHPFFKEIEWETITTRKPPEIRPYIPSTDEEPAFYSDINFTEIETGLSNSTLARLMGFPQTNSNLPNNQQTNDRTQLSESARKAKLEAQKRTNPYHDFVGDDVLIIKCGFVDKKRGLFARRRMFLLTENGRFLYIDTVRNIMKGEVPLSKEVRTEAKNFKTFFVHTPSRTYFLFDPERRALEWCNAIENVRNSVFGKPTEEDLAKKPGNSAKLTKNLSRQFKPSNSN
ncbi:3-phosphoinositide-dependent protein kinase 1 [Aphelenchoides bicaudatus]|nr:3-phosphoinositide-dependent protein kinase 1 [Aphelenchoides bicaudatus]